MKNKEEPLANSRRGNTSGQIDLYHSDGDGPETSSLSRPGSTATARAKQPALSLFPETLMDRVVDEANMEAAWTNVKRNRGAPGPDGVTIAEFPDRFRTRWPAIRQQLLDGTYRPGRVRRKTIAKPDGGQRLLGIPNVLDRLIQQAIVQVLTPIFDPHFSESSFGFRPGRSAHGAAKQVQRTIRRGYRFVADFDLSKFFDRVQHDVLMARVARRVSDTQLLQLIGRYLRAGVMVEGVLQPTEVGTPQGGPLSPILSNINLDDLDKELERRGSPFVRYADDFAVFAKSRRAAERIMKTRWIEQFNHQRAEPVGPGAGRNRDHVTERIEAVDHAYHSQAMSGASAKEGTPKSSQIQKTRDLIVRRSRSISVSRPQGRSVDTRIGRDSMQEPKPKAILPSNVSHRPADQF